MTKYVKRVEKEVDDSIVKYYNTPADAEQAYVLFPHKDIVKTTLNMDQSKVDNHYKYATSNNYLPPELEVISAIVGLLLSLGTMLVFIFSDLKAAGSIFSLVIVAWIILFVVSISTLIANLPPAKTSRYFRLTLDRTEECTESKLNHFNEWIVKRYSLTPFTMDDFKALTEGKTIKIDNAYYNAKFITYYVQNQCSFHSKFDNRNSLLLQTASDKEKAEYDLKVLGYQNSKREVDLAPALNVQYIP